MTTFHPSTPRLTEHARQRAAEMGIATKRVKHALREEHVIARHPDPHLRNLHVVSAVEPDLLLVVAKDDPTRVVTILWRSAEPVSRPAPGTPDRGPLTRA